MQGDGPVEILIGPGKRAVIDSKRGAIRKTDCCSRTRLPLRYTLAVVGQDRTRASTHCPAPGSKEKFARIDLWRIIVYGEIDCDQTRTLRSCHVCPGGNECIYHTTKCLGD